MPRDSNGTYTLPVGNPVVAGTIIESVWANSTLNDVAIALTNSLSRTGQGGMLVPFRNADGTIAAPGMSWANEPSSGWYRKALNEFWYSVGNEDIFQITKDGIQLAPGKEAINLGLFIKVQDDEPISVKNGEQWFESDVGGLYMRYQNPDLTFTWILCNGIGGDYALVTDLALFQLLSEKGVANGYAPLNVSAEVPLANLPEGVANGLATLDSVGKLPLTQLSVVKSQCKFVYVSTTICRFIPYDGNLLWINGVNRPIPAAGVDLAAATLAVDATTYFVYAFWTGSAISLEVSTTAYGQSAISGLMVKIGDETRTLVGMVRKSGGIFYNQQNIRFVRTWFNDPGLSGGVAVTSSVVFSASPWIELDSSFRGHALVWSGEKITGVAQVCTSNGGANGSCYAQIGVDGGGVVGQVSGISVTWSGQYSIVTSEVGGYELTQGYRFFQLMTGANAATLTNVGSYSGVTYTINR